MARTKQTYEENGVQLSKSSICVGDEVTLSYSGLLAQSGAESVYAHIGYGNDWEDKEFIPMERSKDVFKAKIKVTHPDSLNVAFKDSGDNWDNNSFLNYSFEVSDKVKSSKKAASTTKKAASTTKKAASTTKKAASTTKKAASTTKKAASTTKKAASTTKKAASAEKKATSAKKTTAAKATKKTSAKKSDS